MASVRLWSGDVCEIRNENEEESSGVFLPASSQIVIIRHNLQNDSNSTQNVSDLLSEQASCSCKLINLIYIIIYPSDLAN